MFKKIEEVSKLSGVSKRTLQYYDDEGILPVKRSKNNYRLYDDETMERLWKILWYKEMGFDLKEIKLISEGVKQETVIEEKVNKINYTIRVLEEQKKVIEYIQRYSIPVKSEENNQTYKDQIKQIRKEKIESKQSFTEPPPRYTEASLVKALEEKDIGRPSTYSPTITTILARHYIEKEAKQLVPTELGKVVNKLLTENFPDIINVEFTAEIENEFDEIADGKENWKQMISEFYGPFEKELEKVEKELEHVELEEEVSDVPCEKCGRMMVVKYGRYGKFLACPGYPECKNVKPYIETIEEPCPKCGGKVQIRKTKNRRTFYICENNPDKCDYISWTKPKKAEK